MRKNLLLKLRYWRILRHGLGKIIPVFFRQFCGRLSLSWSEREGEEEKWSESLIEPECEREAPLFNYLPLTVFVICVDLSSRAKKEGGVGVG